MRYSSILLAAVAFAALSAPAGAQVVTFSGVDAGANSTDPRPLSTAAATAFNAALLGLGTSRTINFEGSAAALGNFSSLTIGSTTITGTNYFGNTSGQSISNTAYGTPDGVYGYNTTSGGSKFLQLLGGTVTFTFASPIDAFGAYFTGVQLAGETVNFSDGSSQTLAIPNPGSDGGVEFLGVTDAGRSISSVVVNAQNDLIGIDDVRFASLAGAAPEPGTWAMMIVGFGLAGYALRRRQKVTTRVSFA